MSQSRLFTLLALATILAITVFSPARGHDAAHPELDNWFMSLHGRHGIPCCDGSDATRLSDVDWDMHDGHYRVRLEGQWVDVPDSAVVDGPNRAGSTMVWPYYLDGKPIGVRCFMPGTET